MSPHHAVICVLGDVEMDRLAYRCLLEARLRCATVHDSPFAAREIWAALRRRPQLVVVDGTGPVSAVVECVGMVQRLDRIARVLLLADLAALSRLRACSRMSTDGFVLKTAGVDELLSAIGTLLDGRSHFSAGVIESLLVADAGAARPRLSPKEMELLPLLARGMTLRDAAARMSVSYKTADTHRTKLLKKIGVRSRVELAHYAIRERIIDPEPGPARARWGDAPAPSEEPNGADPA